MDLRSDEFNEVAQRDVAGEKTWRRKGGTRAGVRGAHEGEDRGRFPALSLGNSKDFAVWHQKDTIR